MADHTITFSKQRIVNVYYISDLYYSNRLNQAIGFKNLVCK